MLVKGATDILYSINLQAAKTKMFYLMNFIDELLIHRWTVEV